jgi:hypothetical protein
VPAVHPHLLLAKVAAGVDPPPLRCRCAAARCPSLGLSLRAYTTWVPAAPVLNEPLGAEFVARFDF